MKHNNLFFLGALCIGMALHGAADDDRSLTSFTPQELQEHAIGKDGFVECLYPAREYPDATHHVAPFVNIFFGMNIGGKEHPDVVTDVLCGWFYGKKEHAPFITSAAKICAEDKGDVVQLYKDASNGEKPFKLNLQALQKKLIETHYQDPSIIHLTDKRAMTAAFLLYEAEHPRQPNLYNYTKSGVDGWCCGYVADHQVSSLDSHSVMYSGNFFNATSKLKGEIRKSSLHPDWRQFDKGWIKAWKEARELDTPYVVYSDTAKIAQILAPAHALWQTQNELQAKAKEKEKQLLDADEQSDNGRQPLIGKGAPDVSTSCCSLQ